MAEYIMRKTALKILRGDAIARYPSSFAYGLFAAADEVKKIPAADVVEVVRCKDCKYRSGLNGRPPYMFYICTCAQGLTGAVLENHFCYYGERRGDDATD